MELGNKIKQLRLKANLTQEALAEKLNISSQSISKWEYGITMPDITLLPDLSEIFGITIDELFDLSVEQKLTRIESKLDIDDNLLNSDFRDIEDYLKSIINDEKYQYKATYLMAYLYTNRLMSDSKIIKKYAQKGILLDPNKKEFQWMLGKTGNYECWDWDISNHTAAINFYRDVYNQNKSSSLTLCFLIDNLLADNRADEAEMYVKEYERLRPDNIAMIYAYKAGIALARYDEKLADSIINELEEEYGDNPNCLFEIAQYYAKKAQYEKAINYYEESFEKDTKRPRYIDALLSIADIYDIMGNIKKEVETYDRIIACSKDEWGMDEETELKDEIKKRDSLLNKLNKK